MQIRNMMLLATGLLLTSALSSCKKEEMKQVPNTEASSTANKSLARNNNYVLYGTYYEDQWFSGCKSGSGCCMVVVRPVVRWISSASYVMTPDAGDNKLQVDKYKASGVETAYYSQMDVTIGQNGDQSVSFTQ